MNDNKTEQKGPRWENRLREELIRLQGDLPLTQFAGALDIPYDTLWRALHDPNRRIPGSMLRILADETPEILGAVFDDAPIWQDTQALRQALVDPEGTVMAAIRRALGEDTAVLFMPADKMGGK